MEKDCSFSMIISSVCLFAKQVTEIEPLSGPTLPHSLVSLTRFFLYLDFRTTIIIIHLDYNLCHLLTHFMCYPLYLCLFLPGATHYFISPLHVIISFPIIHLFPIPHSCSFLCSLHLPLKVQHLWLCSFLYNTRHYLHSY